MKRKLMLLLACLFMGIGLVTAQTQTVTGVVISEEDGQPVVGASVLVKGTNQGTITDIDGKFTLPNVPSSAKTLQVSYIGMITLDVAIKNNMRIILKSDHQVLDEVMVVAYGTAKKSTFTGSASTVKSDKIGAIQTAEVTNALAGQVAGVQATKSSGQPGQGSTIRIRGIGSFSASNAPLYVVDGIPYDGDIAAINTQDIESMTVLKDAAANALYGARGANGVIIITTKRGNTNEAQITLDAKWGTNRRGIPQYQVMKDPAMYYETAYQAIYNGRYNGTNAADAHAYANRTLLSNQSGGLGYQVYTTPDGEYLIGSNGKLNPNATLGYSDGEYYYTPDKWTDEVFDNSNLREEYNVTMRGGKDGLNYYSSLGYLNDTGLVPGSDFVRYAARLKADYQMKKWLNVGFNMAFTHYNSGQPDSQDGSSSSVNLFYVANLMAPIYPMYVRNPDGSIKIDNNGFTVYDYGTTATTNSVRSFMNNANPMSALSLDQNRYKANIFNGQSYAEVEFIEGLKAKATLSYFTDDTRYNRMSNPYYGQYADSNGYAYVSHYRTTALNQQYLLTYNKEFANDHSISALLGFEDYRYKYQSLYGSKTNLYNPKIIELNNGISNPNTGSTTNNYVTQGIFTQVQYDYLDRYFASVSYRRDASSRFHKDNRWGNFWSVGAGWAINKEAFMEHATWVDLLKFKVSYGAQGNDNLGNYYPYSDQFLVTDSDGDFALSLTYKGNKDLTWETSYNFNIGVDFGLWGGRFNGSVEYFSRKTEDMLYYMPTPASLGYSSFPMNVGSVRNNGLELDLSGVVLRTRDLTWSISANATFLKNRILKLEDSLEGEWISGTRIYAEGKSMYQMYIRKYAGVDENGNATWYQDVTDADGNVTDVTTTTNWSNGTEYATGSILPKVYGGFSTQIEWKGFDLGVLFSYQLGGRIYDNTYSALMHTGDASNAGVNWHKDILKAWTPENTNTNVPKLSTDTNAAYARSISDRFLTNSNYLSLQNITIGYTLPKTFTRRINLGSVRVYGVADNLALWSARKGLDPRQSYTAGSNANYSIMRTISGGITLTF